MALGTVSTIEGDLVAIEILASATATNSPPSGASAGVSVDAIKAAFGGILPDEVSLRIASTAGSASMTATFKLWGYHGSPITQWTACGTGAGASKGLINGGAAVDEGPVADTIAHAEPVTSLAHFQRIYLEITAIGGTSTAVTAWLVARKRYGSY